MLKLFFQNIQKIDKKILKVMYNGFNFCFTILILSILFLLFYILNPVSYLIFESGLILFKIGLTFAVTFFICSIVTDNLKKQLS